MKIAKSRLLNVMCLWALFLAAGVLTAGAQNGFVTLNGYVADASGAAIPGATVIASNTQTGLVRQATTDQAGRYTIPSLPAGTYNVRAERAQFATVDRLNQIFQVGETITLNFAMNVGAVTTTVNVTTSTPLLETTDSTVSTVIQTQQLDELPDLNRSFGDYAALSPGVQSSGGSITGSGNIQIGNSSSFQTGIILDGTSDQAPDEGGQFVLVAQDWIQEFSVMATNATAEYSQASGGILNAITRSGTNSIHGRVYGYFQNASFNADPWVLPPAVATKVPYNLQRIGGMVGGPVIKDKLFYFAGYEFLHNLNSETVSVPAAFLNSYITNGVVPNPTDQSLAMLKIDYKIGSANSVMFRSNVQEYTTTNSGVGGKVPVAGAGDDTFQLEEWAASWTSVLSSNSVNVVDAEAQLGEDYLGCNFAALSGLPEGNPVGNWAVQSYPNITLGCPALWGHHGLKAYTLNDVFSLVKGAHQFKFGGRIENSGNFSHAHGYLDGDYTFGSVGGTSVPFNLTNPATYPEAYLVHYSPHPQYAIPGWSYGMFGQDTWRVSKSLTLNLGLRYDIDASYSNISKYAPVNEGLNTFTTGFNNLGPRVGVAWSPFHDKQGTIIRGGYGIFYDMSHSAPAASYMLYTVDVNQPGGAGYNVSGTVASENPYCTGNSACSSGVPASLETDMKAIIAYSEATATLPNFPVAGGTVDVGGNEYTLPPLPSDPGFPSSPAPTTGVYNIAKNIRVPYTMQYTVGVERQLAANLEVSADYIHINGYDQLITSNTNISPTTLGAVNPNFYSITTFGNGGVFTSNSLLLHAKYQSHRGDALQGAYTYGHANSNGTYGLGSSETEASDPFNYSIDDGPDANDIHQIVNISGTGIIPFGFSLDPIFLYDSASPYTATTTLSVPGCPSYYSVCYPTGYTRDSRRCCSLVSLNTRLAKTVKLGEARSVSGYFEAYNLMNHTNFTSVQTNVTTSTFGEPEGAGAKRQLQLGFRFNF